MKFSTLLLLSFLLSTFAYSQNYKFGKVSKEELQEKVNPAYPDADATVLYREYKVYYSFQQSIGFTLNTEVYERIKIYNPEGYNWGTRGVKVYNYNEDREEISTIKGVTYNLVDGSIEKDKLGSDGVFEERINNYYKGHKFTMPNLKPGSVIEYEYKITSPFYSIDNVDLQYEIPIKKEFVEIKVPEFYVFRNYNNPQSNLSFQFDEESKDVKIEIRGRSGLGTVDYNSFGSDRNKGYGSRLVTYKEKKYTLDETNVPPLKDEGYVDNLDNYKAKSIWELIMINDPDGVPKPYATDWEAVTKSIYENDNFVNELNKTDYFQEDVATAIAGNDDPLSKMSLLLSLAKSKVKWNNGHGFFPEFGVRKAYKEGVGNSGDVNLMLISMLRSVNLNANPVLISTRENGIPVFPTRYGFNYVVAGVESGGKLYLLDATDPTSNVGLLPERAMNWQGRLIRPDGTSNWVGLYPNYTSKKLTYVQAEISNDIANIKVRERLGQHYAKDYRDKYANTNVESQIKGIDKNSEDVTISNFKVDELNTLKPNITRSYEAQSTSLVENLNGEIYISPMLFFARSENPFKEESRTYPLFFDYPKSHKFTITIKIPEGYKVGTIPTGAKANLTDDTISYTYLVQEAGTNLQVSVALEVNTPIIVAQDYEYVKSLFDLIVEKEKEKIVLIKA
tara:strand:- start:2359 stop:4386 length:2028 start_codon:yes stop_codon:yes gene_type:complete